jgi:hypothetical protein
MELESEFTHSTGDMRGGLGSTGYSISLMDPIEGREGGTNLYTNFLHTSLLLLIEMRGFEKCKPMSERTYKSLD